MSRQTILTILLIGTVFYVFGALQQGRQVNINMDYTDQSAYMDYARKMAQTQYEFVGGRNRMPVYPFIMSLFYNESQTDFQFFELGKFIGILIGYVLALLIYFVLSKYTDQLTALTMTLIFTFSVLAFKAPYIQAEILYFFLSWLLFILLLILIQNPGWKIGVLAGIIAGIAHLTKASVLPALGLMTIIMIVKMIFHLVAWYDHNKKEKSSSTAPEWLPSLTAPVLCLIVFLLIISPYLRNSKETFGHYFYNVNSTFYLWCDSWGEVEDGPKGHGDRVGWPDLPDDQLPSMEKYIREHTPGQMVSRLVNGFVKEWELTVLSHGFGYFGLLYLILVLLIGWQNRSSIRQSYSAENHLPLIIFIGLYFSGYLTLYAWWTPIAAGNRFILSIYLPYLFLIARAFHHFGKNGFTINVRGSEFTVEKINYVMLMLVGLFLLSVYPYWVSKFYGGS